MRTAGRRSLATAIAAFVTAALLTFSIVDPAFAYLALVRQGVESADVPNDGDLFGYTVAAGDFNNDGYDDLAVAAPWESNAIVLADHGLVTVNWGTSYGLRHLGAAVLSPGAPIDNSVKYGYAMAVGDFNGDGFDDLAVGSPDLDTGALASTGSVWIYDGFAGGIQLAPSLVFSENETGGTAEAHDRFGFTLATGDFDNNGYDDLAVTAIGEDGDTGDVTIVYSVGPVGLSTATAATFSPGMLGFSVGTSGGWFGKGLATGDLDQDGFDDLAIGAPKTRVLGIGSAGRAYVLYGSGVGLSITDRWKFDTGDAAALQNTPLELGWSVAVGNFRAIPNYGPLQIIAGAPGYEDAGQNDTGGLVMVLHDDGSRALGTSLVFDQPDTPGIDEILPSDRFGETMASGDFDGDGAADLAVGALGNDITEHPLTGVQANAGSVYLYRSTSGFLFEPDAPITHKTLNDRVVAGDNVGRGLAFGRFDGSSRAALAIGAPFADYESYEEGGPTTSNTGTVYVHAPWRQPRGLPHRGSAALDCEGYLIYAQRAWQRMRMASTTKTMTLKLACDAIDDGQNPADPDTMPAWVANDIEGTQAELLTGDIISFRDLMITMMAVSANESATWLGARMSGEGLDAWSGAFSTQSPSFAAAMEVQANAYGLSPATSFTNAPGADGGDHYTTPYDFALLSFLAINEPCIKDIVNRTSSTVPIQRLDLQGQYYPIDLDYIHNFVSGVKALYPSGVGMKGGSSTGAQRCGLFNQYVPLAAAHNSVAVFGTRKKDDPVVGVPEDSLGAIGIKLMILTDLLCRGEALPDQITGPQPTPSPWATLAGISSAYDDTARGLVFNAEGHEANQLGRQIQVDVLRANQAMPTASVTTLLRHASDFCLEGDETRAVGVAPYQQHDGFRIFNRGEVTVSLRITASDPPGYVEAVTIRPGEQFDVAPTDGSYPAPGFQLAVTNLDGEQEACIEIREIGYRSQITLGNGRTSPDVATFYLDRVLSAENDVWTLEFHGLDAVAGNLLDVSAHDPGGTTSVGDGIPSAPKPVASRLLPNMPNPFFRNTTIRFDLTAGGAVDLRVFDVRGRVVRTLASGAAFARGRHAVPWDGRDDQGRGVAPGVYFVKMVAGAATDSWRMLLLR